MNSPKPTDSEQLRNELHQFAVSYHVESREGRTADIDYMMQLIQERDQQRLTSALEALPEKQDEHPVDPETGKAVEVYGYEATFNQAIDQCKAALTTALGPDNSSGEEKKDA